MLDFSFVVFVSPCPRIVRRDGAAKLFPVEIYPYHSVCFLELQLCHTAKEAIRQCPAYKITAIRVRHTPRSL